MSNIHDFEPIWGEWYIDEELGQGSYGTVFSAYRTLAGQREWSAIKHITIPRSQSELKSIQIELGSGEPAAVQERLEVMRDQLISEYLQMKDFKGQTNIVSCEDVMCREKKGEPGFEIFIRMELLECVSNRILDGKIDREQTIKMGIDICNALTLLRNKNIVHRDVKPQNIFVNGNGDYKLGDFGTARSLQGTSAAMSVRGTFAYMSPEAMRGDKTGYVSDIYSLGLVMYRLLNGNKSPFLLPGQASTVSQEDAANMRRMKGEELPMPKNVDKELGKIVLKACAYNPEDRWQSADAMRNALESLYHGTVYRTTGTAEEIETAKKQAVEENERKKKEQQRHKQEQQQADQQAKKKKTVKIACIAAAVVVLAVGAVFGVQAYTRSNAYKNALAVMQEGSLSQAKEAFEKLGNYKDAPQMVQKLAKEMADKETYQQADGLMGQGRYEEAREIFLSLGDYGDAAARAKEASDAMAEQDRQAKYRAAREMEDSGAYEDAIQGYLAIRDYSDAAARAEDLGKKIESYGDAQFQESMEAYKAAETGYLNAGKYLDAPEKALEMQQVQLYLEAEGYAAKRDFKKAAEIFRRLSESQFRDAQDKLAQAEVNMEYETAYQAALKLEKAQRWDEAIAAFSAISVYDNSSEKVLACWYGKAAALMEEGSFEAAADAFAQAGSHSDAQKRMAQALQAAQDKENTAAYQTADALAREGKYAEAIEAFAALGEYSDAAARSQDLKERMESYSAAQFHESMEDYGAAEAGYLFAGNYLDAPAKALEMQQVQLYLEAEGYAAKRDFKKAAEIFRRLAESGFRDAEERRAQAEADIENEAAYQAALKLEKARKWDEAIAAFLALGGYYNSGEKVLACWYGKGEALVAEGSLSLAADAFAKAGSYQDAQQRRSDALQTIKDQENAAAYQAADALAREGNYTEAYAAFTALGQFSDAAAQAEALRGKIESYSTAQFHESMKEYAAAEESYLAAGSYQDAPEKALEMQHMQMYLEAESHERERNFKKASEIYKTLAELNFRDAALRLAQSEANQLKEAVYQLALSFQQEKRWDEAIEKFTALEEYHDSAVQLAACWYGKGETLMEEDKLEEAAAAYEAAGDYSNAAARKAQAEAAIVERGNRQSYDQAEALRKEGKYEEAIAIYTALGNYGNAQEQVKTLNEQMEHYRNARFHESMEEYGAAEESYLAAGLYQDAPAKVTEMQQMQLYLEAESYMENRDFKKAAEIYKRLAEGKFRDAQEKIAVAEGNLLKEEAYQAALNLKKAKKWDEAIAAFGKLEGYYDSEDQIAACWYSKAEALVAAKKLKEAAEAFGQAGTYSDAVKRRSEVEAELAEQEKKNNYQKAEGLVAEGKYEAAIEIFLALGEYSNAADRVTVLQQRMEHYKTAKLRESMKDYETAQQFYEAAGTYADAEAKAVEMANWQLYEEARAFMEAEEYEQAIALYQYLANAKFRDAEKLLAQASGIVRIIEQPKDTVASAGKRFSATVKAAGANLTYTWYYKNKDAKTFIKSTQKTNAYSSTMTEELHGRQIYCVVTDGEGNEVTTNTVTLSLPELKIIKQPASLNAKAGATIRPKVEAQGDGLTYEWYYRDYNDGKFIKSAKNTPVYETNMKQELNGRQLYCVVSDMYGNSATTEVFYLSLPVPENMTFSVQKRKAVITGYTGKEEELIIPAVAGGFPVATIGEKAFEENNTLRKITLPGCVTTIEDNAFDKCIKLEEVVLSKSLQHIGDQAFRYCGKVAEMELPATLTNIGVGSFMYCTALEKVTLPAAVEAIGENAFSFCSAKLTFKVTANSYAHRWCITNKVQFTGAPKTIATPKPTASPAPIKPTAKPTAKPGK